MMASFAASLVLLALLAVSAHSTPCPDFVPNSRPGLSLTGYTGSMTPGRTYCTECSSGQHYFKGFADCAPGNAMKASCCEDCPQGKYGTGQSDLCFECGVGQYAPPKSSGCTSCLRGKTTVATAGASSEDCVACSAGKMGGTFSRGCCSHFSDVLQGCTDPRSGGWAAGPNVGRNAYCDWAVCEDCYAGSFDAGDDDDFCSGRCPAGK